jgi:hypothetical protein
LGSKDALSTSGFAKVISNSENGSISLVDPEALAGNFLHFTLIGDSAYRFEEDHDLAKALLSFNRPETVSSLKVEFNLYRAVGVPYEA